MKTVTSYPGTKQHQAMLDHLVTFYQEDLRILAVIVFGSLGRGSWDEFSDLDLDIIVADDVLLNVSTELDRLCASFASLNERAAVILSGGDEGDIVLESLLQLSIRYHPLSQTSPNIIDSMRILAGSLNAAEIIAAGKKNHSGDERPIRQLLDSCVRYAVVANVEFQRKHFWAANEILHRIRNLLMDIFARTHGGFRGYQFFDIHADRQLQQKLGAALPSFDAQSLRESFLRTLDIVEHDLRHLSGGQLALSAAQISILDRIRLQIDSSAAFRGKTLPG